MSAAERKRAGAELIDQQFLEFFRTFRGADGDFKYRARIRQMAVPAPAPEGSPFGFRYVEVKSTTLFIDFTDLLVWDNAEVGYKLANLLVDRPDEALHAARQALVELARVEAPELLEKARDDLTVGVHGLPIRVPLRSIERRHIGKLISFDGTVVKSTRRYVYVKKAAWVCKSCGETVYTESVGDKVVRPETCTGCGKSSFEEDEARHKLVDWRRVTVQEPPEEVPPGQVPATAEVELINDLAKVGNPGDKVIVTGIVRAVRKSQRDARIALAVEATGLDVVAKDTPVQITPEDERRIRELAARPDVEELILSSFAPSVHGLEPVKKAIILQLFGGVSKAFPDGVKVRGDIHVLLVGDPGTAKSQLLKYAASIAPRGIYTTGKGSTAAGLTATVAKDPESGAFTLEVGALVLADLGLCAVDEIDKMDSKDRVAMHEAMEQQTVSVAKAGIVATLNARTAVLAAANPLFGRYDPNRPISENISLPPTILSRFDLIFLIRDTPSREGDSELAAHIRAYHSGAAAVAPPPIDPMLLRKYVAYARAHCKPRLTEEAGKKLEAFYVELRSKAANPGSPVPITPRQLEALIRLAEAHAKMRLSDVVAERDAEAAIELMMEFLRSAGIDVETGEIDIDAVMTGKPRSQREKMALLWDMLKRMLKENQGADVKREDFIAAAVERGFEEEFVEKVLAAWYDEGKIIEPKRGHIRPVL